MDKLNFKVVKMDEDQNLVFGWANVSIFKDGEVVVDTHDDIVEPEELEVAMYAFNLQYREMGVNHVGEAEGFLIESFVATPDKLEKMGLARDALPLAAWVGFHIPRDEVFKRVKKGELTMFSIQGTARREEA